MSEIIHRAQKVFLVFTAVLTLLTVAVANAETRTYSTKKSEQRVTASVGDAPLIRIISGEVIQGGMVVARALNPTMVREVRVLNEQVIHNSHGVFVFGLGRDQGPKLDVSVYYNDGSMEIQTFDVTLRKYEEQRIEGVASRYVSPPESVLARIRGDAQAVKKARKARRQQDDFLSTGFIKPANGVYTGFYGSRRVFNGVPKRPHYGLDIAGPVGEPVMAPAAGVVTLVNKNMYYSGGTLIIDHGLGVSSTFIHLSDIFVKQGQEIKQGQKIAAIGETGRVTGPHLDWRVNWFAERLDPMLLLPEAEQK